ncbi:serine hydrolase domain-containing protein [Paraflavitalea pollutisoli]|uniref:serine hydrolase domain-containing protein n=1 Tax=Paraflavitalea pollutisoli TaxID=3034143 RepID=UPI0023ED597E|nr:serine hydrolase [Paraflavitalea sp. H1-2-19X]
MINFRRLLRRLLLSLLLVVIVTGIYTSLPRVRAANSIYGRALATSQLLPSAVQDSLHQYLNDPAQHYAAGQQVVALWREQVIFEVGDARQLINCHSARKSIMSLLMGIAQEKGLLHLTETLGDLGIDESRTPLTAQEKTATIRDLLMARSGVYLPAEAETDFAKANRPRRGQYEPGAFFFYNNFDFNVLGAILEKKSGLSIGAFMEKYLAKPLGMQDFAPTNVVYGNPWPVRDDRSDYRVYWMYLSARDLARIGALVAQLGRWQGRQVVGADWIRESTRAYTTELHESMWPFDGYGYLWWLDKDNNTIWADGYGGQFLLIDTSRGLAIAQRNFTGNSLMSAGLFMMRQRPHGGRKHLMHVYDVMKEYIP